MSNGFDMFVHFNRAIEVKLLVQKQSFFFSVIRCLYYCLLFILRGYSSETGSSEHKKRGHFLIHASEALVLPAIIDKSTPALTHEHLQTYS